MRSSFKLLAVLLLATASVAAHASKFTFTIAGPGISGSGLLFGSADPFIAGAFDITSATGSINGFSIGIAPGSTFNSSGNIVDPSGSYFVNDVIYLNGSQGNQGGFATSFVDNNGLLFVDSASTLSNVYSDGNGDEDITKPGTYPNATPIRFEVAATPEPSSLVLLGTGIVGFAGMARRRFAAR